MIEPNIAALSTFDASALESGNQAWVQTVRATWRLDTTSTLAVDGITIVAATPAGRWIRMPEADPTWLQVANWYIDAVAGNDENSGQSQVAALRTHAELERRWGKGLLNPPLDPVQNTRRICRVFILTDLPTTDPIYADVSLQSNGYLWYTGELARAVLASGTITAVTALSAVANQAWQITDPTITWATYLNKRCRVTSAGTNLNALFYVARDMGANVARISNPGTPQPLLGSLGSVAYNPRTLVPGDTYVIENLPTVSWGTLNIRSGNSNYSFLVGELNHRNILTINGNGTVTALAMIYGNYFAGAGSSPAMSAVTYLMNNHHNGGVYSTASVANILGGLFTGNGITGYSIGPLLLAQAPLFQACPIQGKDVRIASAQIFDNAVNVNINPGGDAVAVGKQQTGNKSFAGTIQIIASPFGATEVAPQSLFGNGNAGVGVFVPGGSQFLYPPGSVLTVTGTQGDFQLDAGTTSRPFDETTGAYATARNNTWANLAATIVGGGFGGSAHNVQANAHLVQMQVS